MFYSGKNNFDFQFLSGKDKQKLPLPSAQFHDIQNRYRDLNDFRHFAILTNYI